MSKPSIEWSTLTNDEVRDLMDEGREESENRIRLLMEAMNGRPKGPGRPPKNGTKLTAAEEQPD